ncbi:hypothetical protein NC653_000336 [Populus alba x Populus x berolinensis]|uniref:Uncharacterized protein n=1 Tax=Populus alba x Populus x berolinensis TaxID=444605 RepID=A0AAD6RJE0_9ROSI|nr:hypothetical protein NC653_000336 [Populus alba x Populus x berolinensis]
MKFLRSTCLELRRNSAETKDSIFRRSSGDFERAARKKPRYILSTCFCIPESLVLPPVDGPISQSQCTSLIRFWSSKALINKENNISRLCSYWHFIKHHMAMRSRKQKY